MKASLDQVQCIGEQFAQLASGSNLEVDDVVELVAGQRTFEANATMARTADEVVGSVIDLLV
jgi:flagellar basal body rod protein FlgG